MSRRVAAPAPRAPDRQSVRASLVRTTEETSNQDVDNVVTAGYAAPAPRAPTRQSVRSSFVRKAEEPLNQDADDARKTEEPSFQEVDHAVTASNAAPAPRAPTRQSVRSSFVRKTEEASNQEADDVSKTEEPSNQEADDVVTAALSHHKQKDFQKVYHTLKEGLARHPEDANISWMLARACFDIGNERVTKADEAGAKQIFAEGIDYASAVVKSGATCAPAYKWNAVLLGKLGEFSSMTDKIKNSFLIKDLALKAAEIDPDDATTQHLLGAWCYQVASVTWVERQAASLIFATPPESSFEEAEKYLLRANEIDPAVFENCMLLGDLCAAAKSRRSDAKQWYGQLLNLPCVSEKERALHKEASVKLGRL